MRRTRPWCWAVWMHDNGRGVGTDKARALGLYRRGCDKGNAAGCKLVGQTPP